MQMRGLFISGTDTGVGKTVLMAVLLTAARTWLGNWFAAKPVQTGVRPPRGPRRRPVGDLAIVARAAGWAPPAHWIPCLQVYVFTSPSSPHRAAELAGKHISLRRMVDSLSSVAEHAHGLLVEGAGGLFVPLDRRHLMLDLIREVGLPVVLAIRPGLGTLNHTLLSCEALERRNIPLAGCVAVQSLPGRWTPLMGHNLETLKQRGVPVLGRVPYLSGFEQSPRRAIQRALRLPTLRWVRRMLIQFKQTYD